MVAGWEVGPAGERGRGDYCPVRLGRARSAVRSDRRSTPAVERALARPGRPHGRGDLGDAGPAVAAEPDRGHAQALRPDLRGLRGAAPAGLQPPWVAADGED